jgi:septum formation protein
MALSLVLASQSPRRQELLTQIGYVFSCQPADINEEIKENETPTDYVERLAIEKAKETQKNLKMLDRDHHVVLGSDTSVVYEGSILGKPENLKECILQLQMLSDSTHQVLTSIAAVYQDKVLSEVITTKVTFKKLTLDEITRYWQTEEPKDKAGSYGIQGIAAQFVTNISGSYSAVVGLPLYETSQLLAKFGLNTPIQLNSKENV